jgi:ankyrin repeat protein
LNTHRICARGFTDNVTPLHLASRQGYLEIACFLLDYSADITGSPTHTTHSDVQKSLAYFSSAARMRQSTTRTGELHLIWHCWIKGMRRLHKSFSSTEHVIASTRTRIESQEIWTRGRSSYNLVAARLWSWAVIVVELYYLYLIA